MQNPNDELENIFQQRFQNFEAQVPDDAFDLIQTRMAAARPPSNRRWYTLAAALLLLISTCTYLRVAKMASADKTYEASKTETGDTTLDGVQTFSEDKNKIQNSDNQVVKNFEHTGKVLLNNKDLIVTQASTQANTQANNQSRASVKATKIPRKQDRNSQQKIEEIGKIDVNNSTTFNNTASAQIIAFGNLAQSPSSILPAGNSTALHQDIRIGTPQFISSLPFSALNWSKTIPRMIEYTAVKAVEKKIKKVSPLTFDYSGAAIWTAYHLMNNTQDQILINEIIVPKEVSVKRLGLRLGLGANLALSKKLNWQNRLSLQISQFSVQYVSKEADYSTLITARVAQSIVVQPSVKTTMVSQQQTQLIATIQSGFMYQLPLGIRVNADVGYQYNQSFEASRWVSLLGVDYSFKSKKCTYAIGPFVELPLTKRNFSFQETLYFSPTYVGFQLRLGR
jgi:hypothetical protein